MKNPNSGNGPGMPSRRLILKGVAAAPIIALPVSAASSAPQEVAENPKLLALGEEMPRVEAAYHEAVAAWDAMWREWAPKWPLAPDPCTSEHATAGSDLERDLRGAGLCRPGQDRPLHVMSLKNMEWRKENYLRALAANERRKRKAAATVVAFWQAEVDRMEIAMMLLPGYLDECEQVRRASKYRGIEEARGEAADGVFAFVQKVLSEPSFTLAGVRVKAEAAAMIGRMCRYDAGIRNMHCAHRPPSETMAVMLGKAMLEVAAG